MILAGVGKAAKAVFGLLPVADWLFIGAIGLAFGWHVMDKHAAVEAAHAEDQAAIEAANIAARSAHDEKQKALDETASAQNSAIGAKVDAISRQTSAISAKLAGLKPSTYKAPLPADCVLDAERQKDANEALQR